MGWGGSKARMGPVELGTKNQGQQFPELVRVQKSLSWSHIYYVGHSFVFLT